MTTAVKKTSRTSECDGREREEILKEDLEMERLQVAEKQDAKKRKIKELRSFRVYKRQKRRRKHRIELRSNKGENVKTQNCLFEKNSNEKLSNKACI